MQPLLGRREGGGGGQKTLKRSLLVLCGAEESGGLTEGIGVGGGQRLIKHRRTFAPALLTNLSPVEMTAAAMLNLHLGPISPPDGPSVRGAALSVMDMQ